jgi:putative glutamine amidotransferase
LLILSGGNDINGYNGNDSLVLERDTYEHNLIKKWIAEGKPILGICRGTLLLNLYYNGTISKCTMHDKVTHIVTDQNNNKHEVNSHHRHKIETLANKLNATTVAYDDTIESFQHKTLPIYGLMWHPERQQLEGNEYYLPDNIKDILEK